LARVADDVLPEHVRDVLHVAPVLRVAVLQPEDAGGDVGRNALDMGAYTGFSRFVGVKIFTAS
jgi:hypothetical protein